MWRRVPREILVLALWTVLSAARVASAADEPPAFDGWACRAARDEIRPAFSVDPAAGPDGKAALRIAADQRNGLDGYWIKEFPVQGGRHYRFQAFWSASGVANPGRSIYAQIKWTDAKGRLVSDGGRTRYPDFPPDRGTNDRGWTELSAIYRVPDEVTRAEVELRLRWAPGGSVRWGGVTLEETTAPEPRMVRLATVHFRPTGGKTPEENRRLCVPFIEEAAGKKADLVVLGECITFVGLGLSYAEVAEPVPGPSTEFFGRLAKERDLYIVAPVVERDGRLLYNTAALVGPDGRMVGKYRKVCLPRGEYDAGITAGCEYPVFQTRFGQVGMMICWDLQFPQVARKLAEAGAEVIALPIWGGNPKLAAARAIENQIHLVTSTYTDDERWMKSGVWDPDGNLVVRAKEWGSVAVYEVDLNETHLGFGNIGDLKSRIPREGPTD